MSQIKASDIVATLNGKQDPVTTSTSLSVNTLKSYGNVYTPAIYIYADGIGNMMSFGYDGTYRYIKGMGYKRLHITSKVRINTTDVCTYSIEVPSATDRYPSSGNINSVYFNYGQALTYSSTYNSDVCALFRSSIWINGGDYGLLSTSDKRIKTNIHDIDDDNALQMIMNVEPKTYEYIDKVEGGNKRVYGFIAQQIREVIPDAVALEPHVVPNIYEIGTLTDSNLITMNIDISNTVKIGSNISLITSNLGKKEYKVIDVNSNQFTIDTNINDSNNVFVYGTKVDDFHILNKSYIYTLNVCATQELYKLIQLQINKINQLNEKYQNMSNIIQVQHEEINMIINNK